VDAAQAALDNAQALTRNDLTLGASLDHYPGTSTRQLELRLSMPLQTHYAYQGEIARALAGLNQARTQLGVRLAAQLELQRLQQSLRTTLALAQGYERDILPRARQVAAGAELAYGKGAIPLVDLLDARRTLRATLIDPSMPAPSTRARAACGCCAPSPSNCWPRPEALFSPAPPRCPHPFPTPTHAHHPPSPLRRLACRAGRPAQCLRPRGPAGRRPATRHPHRAGQAAALSGRPPAAGPAAHAGGQAGHRHRGRTAGPPGLERGTHPAHLPGFAGASAASTPSASACSPAACWPTWPRPSSARPRPTRRAPRSMRA
jgi:hypothetical protein